MQCKISGFSRNKWHDRHTKARYLDGYFGEISGIVEVSYTIARKGQKPFVTLSP
jgi:hypothetical protein